MEKGVESSKNIDLAQGAQEPGLSKKVVLSWDAPSFQKNEQNLRWYLGAGALIVALIAYSAWQRDWFMIAIIIIISAVLFWYIRTSHPTNVNYQITPMGINAGEHFYPFSEIHSFWIVYNEKVKTLQVVFIKKYLPTLVIGIDSIDPLLLKGYLLKKIPEQEDRGESLVDKLIRVLRL